MKKGGEKLHLHYRQAFDYWINAVPNRPRHVVLSNFKEIPQTVAGANQAFTRMFAAVRFGRVTMQQFSNILATTAPAAKIAGQSFNSMAGTLAFLSRALGPNKASVGYARLVEVLSGNQMQEGLKKVGVNIDGANGKMLQLDKVIQILVKRFTYLAQGGIKALNFFKDIGNLQSTIQARISERWIHGKKPLRV